MLPLFHVLLRAHEARASRRRMIALTGYSSAGGVLTYIGTSYYGIMFILALVTGVVTGAWTCSTADDGDTTTRALESSSHGPTMEERSEPSHR